MKILDVGCGPGSITVDLAKRVRRGHVTGVDFTEEPFEAGRALATSQKVANVEFKVGDIHKLPFENETFDIVHAHQVLQHIRDPVQGLKEMKRVAKKGGLIAVRETDSFRWYPQLPGLQDWYDLHYRVSKAKGGNPHPGSRIHVWAHEAGFERENIKRSAGTWCYSSKEEREYWSGTWVERLIGSGFKTSAIEGGHCSEEDLERMAAAWKEWGLNEDGWFAALHGEILCRV